MPTHPTRDCKGPCEGTYDIAFFARWGRRALVHGGRRDHICKGCRQDERDARKRRNRARVKARDVRRREADKFIKMGKATSREDFWRRYGWPDVPQVMHDIEHAFANSCPDCRRPFAEMPHGLRDCTLDVIDPEAEPHYGINTRWICLTCNQHKTNTPPDEYGRSRACWAQWRENMKRPWRNTLFPDWMRNLPTD